MTHFKAQTYWTTSDQIKIARRMLEFVLREGMSELEALRKAAADAAKPHRSIRSLTQLSMLSKGMTLAKFSVEKDIKDGTFFKPEASNLLDLMRPTISHCADVSTAVEKRTTDFIPEARKPYVLVVGTLQGQERLFSSARFEIRFWSVGDSLRSLAQNVKGAAHTLVWVDKISHGIYQVVKNAGPFRPVSGGLSSLKSGIEEIAL